MIKQECQLPFNMKGKKTEPISLILANKKPSTRKNAK